jgi:hypothetical protein
MTYKLDRTLHLTHAPGHPDAKAVEEDDPAGRFVLGGAGAEIPEADAERYGLLKEKAAAGKAAAEEAESEQDAPAEAKAVDAPPENKAVSARKAERK